MLRHIDFVYHSTLGLRVKKKERRLGEFTVEGLSAHGVLTLVAALNRLHLRFA